ncbi:MAG: cytochrome C biogenesis protein [Betaproteobacteria bacterium]|nr:cytochrome C biogenesis protein [Betaproteobacteria bacterium]MSQ88395.1 cytochrome C biogenesis protein [Betaproteobacteria bacterium]
MPDIVIHVVASALYAALALHFWLTRWRVPFGRWRASPPAPGGLRGWERTAILLPLTAHGVLLYSEMFAHSELRFGFAYALSAMLWLAVLFYWLESFLYDLDALQAPVLALAALSAPLPALFPGHIGAAYAVAFEFRLHLVLAMLAYSLFTIALLHALLMAALERRLHRKQGAQAAVLPPLLTLERLLFRLLGAGFLLLTLTLATGFAFSETLFGRVMRFDHKTVFAVLSWLTFGLLLAGRQLYGWRGRTALRWTLSGFVLLLLAYIGSRFVLEVVLDRG